MHPRRWLLGLAFAALAAAPACGQTESGLGVALAQRYIFRGTPLGPSAGLAADAYLTRPLSDRLEGELSAWSWLRLGGGRGVQEVDLDGRLTWRPTAGLAVTAGFVCRDRNNTRTSPAFGGQDAYEAYAGLALDGDWRPSVTAWYDVGSTVGLYLRGDLRHAWELDPWRLEAEAWVGFDSGRGIDLFSDGGLRFAFATELEPGLTFGPRVELWFPSHQVDPGANGFRGVLAVGFEYRVQ